LERSERIAPAQKLGALRDVLLHVQIGCFSPDKEIGIAVEGVAACVLLLELKGKRTTRPKGWVRSGATIRAGIANRLKKQVYQNMRQILLVCPVRISAKT
jgi:hypothetical protein